jgi:NhaP-type Na+/H+ or K+/H+ antiporter
MLDVHIGWFLLAGTALLAMTVLPGLFSGRPLSLPIVYVAAGAVLFWGSEQLAGPMPLTSSSDALAIEVATEVVVIISLAGVGLKLERRPGLASWSSVWRLLAITMPLTIAATVALGAWWIGLGLAPAILLGAVLAPTDPVLASDVQVAGPKSQEDEVRFTLTAEAGLNDGLAFPFTYLAIGVASAGSFGAAVGRWVTLDVAYRIVAGVAAGWLLGRGLAWFAQRSERIRRSDAAQGLFSLGSILLVYGLTEAIEGYGFIAVFIAALTRTDDDQRVRMHAFTEQFEAIMLAVVLIGFGALVGDGILAGLRWRDAAIAVALVVVVRPVAGLIGLLGTPVPRWERAAIAFFGIRGMGSVYYLAYAYNNGDFTSGSMQTLWAITSLTILISIAVHGITATPFMARLRPRPERC